MESRPDDKPAEAAAEAFGADLIIPLLACLLTAYYILSTSELVWEARATGVVIGAILLALCALQFARIAFGLAAGRGRLGFAGMFSNTNFNRQRLALIVLVALFIATIDWIGTTLGLFLLLIGSMLVLGIRNVGVLIAISSAASATVYLLLIHLLNTRLPRGIVERLLAAAFGGGG